MTTPKMFDKHITEGQTLDRYADMLDDQFKTLAVAFVAYYESYRTLPENRVKSRAHCIKQLQSIGEAICAHYAHGLEMLEAIYPDGIPQSYDKVFIERMHSFVSEANGDHTSTKFISAMRAVAKAHRIPWPAEFFSRTQFLM